MYRAPEVCSTPQGGCWYRTLSLISALALLVAAGAWAGGDSEQPVAAAATEVDSSSMEALALAAMVAAGELPPLAERLPSEPLVITRATSWAVTAGPCAAPGAVRRTAPTSSA